jgi:AraC-like DNA-binding protein
LYEILYHFQKRNYGTPKKYQGITCAIKEINENYRENHKILYYAQMCNMSESNFRKLFREYTGKSPIEYRNNIRISAFEKLMESREFTVSEAAYLVGFNNMSFFYDTYNKYKNNT